MPELIAKHQQKITERLAEALGVVAPEGTQTAIPRDEVNERRELHVLRAARVDQTQHALTLGNRCQRLLERAHFLAIEAVECSARELLLQIANKGIVELAKIQFRPLQSIVPPDRVGIPFDKLEEPLDHRLFARIASRAAIGICGEGGVAPIKKIEEARRKIFEARVA